MSMENQIPVVVGLPKRLWNVVRLFFFMVRKGICKRKLLLDLNLILKRGKLAGKAVIGNLILHHHHHPSANANAGVFSFLSSAASKRPGEYEFSCSNTPNHAFLLGHASKRHLKKKHTTTKQQQYHCIEEEVAAINAALELMALNDAVDAASPLLPGLGFGRSPMVRQLRVTDSPFPVVVGREEADCRVDEAAEDFIRRFYSQLRRQSLTEG